MATKPKAVPTMKTAFDAITDTLPAPQSLSAGDAE